VRCGEHAGAPSTLEICLSGSISVSSVADE
jgi:hypothetical protein